MSTKINENAFEFGGIKYFRGNAQNVALGTYGRKRDPIGAKAYVEAYSRVKSEHLKDHVKYGATVKIDWGQVSKIDFEANVALKVFGIGVKAGVDIGYEKAKEAKLELVLLSINEGALKTMLNQEADGARNFLDSEGNDARIVSAVWVIMSAELSGHFTAYGKASASAAVRDNELDVTVTGGKHGSQTITLSKGSTFAYMCHKVKDWNKGKTKIEDLEDDQKGMG